MAYFFPATDLSDRIEKYFRSIGRQPEPVNDLEKKTPGRTREQEPAITTATIRANEPQPAMLTGLALFLGFSSLDEFEIYEQKGLYKKVLRAARLRVMCEYEKKLHQQAPTGAIFALKSLGWADRDNASESQKEVVKSFTVNVILTGPDIATTEKEVMM